MTFLAAGWLALFAPFAAVVLWTLRRTPTMRATTSAFLWPSNPIASSIRSRRRPPAWTIAALASTASAIVALATPATPATRAKATVFVVLDPSFRIALGPTSLASSVWARLVNADVAPTLVVPGQPDATSIGDVRPTARTTTADVVASVTRLTRAGRDVVAVTDAPIERGEHVRAIAPSTAIDASISTIGGRTRADGAVDVLVRVARTPPSPGNSTLSVRSGDAIVTKPVEWLDDAIETSVIVRLPHATETIEARVDLAGDAVPLDDVARLSRDAFSNVRLTLDGTLSVAVQRFATAYARIRTADGDRPAIDVTITSEGSGHGKQIMIGDGTPVPPGGVTERVEHPVLANVDLDVLWASNAEMPAGLKVIASRDGRPIVAVRDVGDDRAVWLGLAVDAASREPAWVVLLDQAIAWTAGTNRDEWSAVTSDAMPLVGWHATAVGDARVDASPGMYVDADERSRAVNLPVAKVVSRDGESSDLSAWLASREDRARRSLAAWPAGLAAVLAIVAAGLLIAPERGRDHLDVRALAP